MADLPQNRWCLKHGDQGDHFVFVAITNNPLNGRYCLACFSEMIAAHCEVLGPVPTENVEGAVR